MCITMNPEKLNFLDTRRNLCYIIVNPGIWRWKVLAFGPRKGLFLW